MKKPETQLKERVLERLKKFPYTYVDKIQQVARRGSLDIYLCLAGIFVAIELKSDEKIEPDPLQKYKLKRINECFGLAITVHPGNEEEMMKFLEKLVMEEVNERKRNKYQRF